MYISNTFVARMALLAMLAVPAEVALSEGVRTVHLSDQDQTNMASASAILTFKSEIEAEAAECPTGQQLNFVKNSSGKYDNNHCQPTKGGPTVMDVLALSCPAVTGGNEVFDSLHCQLGNSRKKTDRLITCLIFNNGRVSNICRLQEASNASSV